MSTPPGVSLVEPLPEDERLARMRLAAAPGVRTDAARALLQAFGSARAALAQEPRALSASGLLAPQTAERLLASARAFPAEATLRRCAREGIRVLHLPENAEVPDLLKSIPDPPILLYCLGSLAAGAERPALAVVGSRRPTAYGARMARRLGRQAAEAGLTVVSGLARGVDTQAHAATLEAGGITWAVLGSGLFRVYPGENAALTRRIADSGGAVLSELPPEAEPLAENFPRRNRILSGLSTALVVVEGTKTSGSLITAKLAAEQGRDVFAVPGPADSELSRGPHLLIKEGAGLAGSLDDILDALPRLKARVRPVKATPDSGPGQDVLSLLKSEPRSLEELSAALRRDIGALSRELVDLELKGEVVALGAQRYGLK